MTSDRATALTAVSGLGGVGKTQLALEYTYRYASRYQAVLWVPSEEPTAMASAFAGLALVLDLPEQAKAEQGIAIEAVMRWLSTHQGWLLVFDNSPGPEQLEGYLPDRDTGHVLITSRNPNWLGVANSVSVEKFQRGESIEFLLERTRSTERDSADALADELGDLPLALEQAGAYVERTGGSLSHYESLYRDRYHEMWELDAPSPNYNETVATTWSISIEQLPATAADLLNLCAFLAPDDIPRKLVSLSADHLPEPLAGAASDILALDRAVAELRGYSLLEVSNDSWSVHRLVQAVVRGRLDDGDRNVWTEAAVAIMSAAFPYNSDEVKNWPTCARLLPHALAAAGHAEGLEVAAAATGLILNQVGLYLWGRAQFLQAKSALERAVAIDEVDLGADHPTVAIRLNNLGNVLRGLGDLEDAREHIQRALEISEAALGADHPTVAIRLNNLANVLRGLGDLQGAREYIQRALDIHEAAYGPDHRAVATDLNNLGDVLRSLGDLEGAREYIQRALDIHEAAYGPDHPYVATVLNNLGNVLSNLGDLEGAREHVQRALDIDEAAYGPDHPEVATDLNNLGGVLRELGDLEGAREHSQRALEISEVALGADHPTVAIRLNSLGAVLRDLGDLEGAREHVQRALEISRDRLGEDRPTTVGIRRNLESLPP